MEVSRVLLEFHDLKVEVETTPNQELMDHMHSTVLGTPGGFRYRHLDLEDRLRAPGENYFMYLRKNGKMLGSVGFVGRHTRSGGQDHDGWMIRYFSIKAPMRATPTKRKDASEIKAENKRSSVLGRFIQPVFAHPGQLRGDGQNPEAPSLIYALIETKNLRSMNFSSQMGLETVSQVANFSFSRMQPRTSERLEVLPAAHHEEMRRLLREFYGGYELYFEGPLFQNDAYFVIRQEGEVVAGVQTWDVRWGIEDFGGALANRVVGLLSSLPYVNKRLNREEQHLLAFDQLYCKPGFEGVLYELLEGVLARKGVYLGLLMMDRQSGLYQVFQQGGKLGVLHRILGEFNAELRIRFNHFPEDIVQKFKENPIFIPTYDNS
jgi:hypothetical protein